MGEISGELAGFGKLLSNEIPFSLIVWELLLACYQTSALNFVMIYSSCEFYLSKIWKQQTEGLMTFNILTYCKLQWVTWRGFDDQTVHKCVKVCIPVKRKKLKLGNLLLFCEIISNKSHSKKIIT